MLEKITILYRNYKGILPTWTLLYQSELSYKKKTVAQSGNNNFMLPKLFHILNHKTIPIFPANDVASKILTV